MVRFSFSPGGKQSRRDRLEQAKRAADEEKTRRRNFGFLKTGDKRMSSVSLSRTREHAKQLAMVYSDPAETPTSSYANQELLGGGQEHFDPFGNQASSIPQDIVPNARASGSLLDHHFATTAPSKQEREPTTSTQDSFDTASVGSAYDMEFLSSRHSSSQPPAFTTTPGKRSRKKQGPSLDQFVENTRSPFQGASSYSGGGDSLDRNSRERSVISMPTIPTNSSMQASFARHSSSESPGGAKAGAAARRRMRNQMRQSSSASVNSFDDSASQTSTPPESPASSVKHTPGSSGRNRVAAYQRGQNGSFYSQTSSTNNSLQSGTDSNYTSDAGHQDGGFTFDAFGLDQSQVEREVNEAMQELAGQGMPGFSVFFNADSDGEFPSQNWDSPANSRRSSPVPSDSEQEGFVDGFKVAAQPSTVRQTHPGSSPVSSEHSFSSPASRRLVRSHAKGNTTPPRWEDHSKSAKKVQPRNIFDQPVSNPWKEDPWGSGDDSVEFSDSGNNSDFGGTKSEVLVSSLQPQLRYSSDAARSDVGAATAYQKSVSFHEDVVLPTHPQNHQQQHDSADDNSDSLNESLAQEFAQEFADNVSPRHNEIPTQDTSDYHSPSQQSFPQGTSQYNVHPHGEQQPQGFQGDAHYDSPHGHDDHARVQKSQTGVPGAASDRYGRSDYGAHGNANEYEYSNQPHEHADNQETGDYGPVRPTSYRSGMAQKSPTAENRFRSFRSKYESSKDTRSHDESVDHQQEPQNPVHAQNSSHEYGTLRNSYAAAKAKIRSPGPATPQSEQSAALPSTLNPTTYSDYGPVTDKNVTPTNASETDFVLSPDKDEGGEDLLGEQHTIDNESRFEQNLSRAEEKKDDDEPSGEVKRTGNLKSQWQQWEAKSQMKSSSPKAPVKPSWMKPTSRAPQASMQGVEMLTPEIVEARRIEKQKNRTDALRRTSQEHPSQSTLQRTSPEQNIPESQLRATECQDERKSFASLRERLKPSLGRDEAQTKSDAGGYRSPMAADMVDRLRRVSPRGGAEVEAKSDIGSPASFLASVKLKKTEPPKRREDEVAMEQSQDATVPGHSERPLSYRERQAQQQTVQVAPTVDTSPQETEAPVERKLTYRERRELELKREQEAKANVEQTQPKEEPKKDVAALIRKRVAANKQKSLASPTPATGNANSQASSFRDRLKPVDTGVSPSHGQHELPKKLGTQQSSPAHGSQQPVQPARRSLTTTLPSPQARTGESVERNPVGPDAERRPADVVSKMLSPASVGSNMSYSTDNTMSAHERAHVASPPKQEETDQTDTNSAAQTLAAFMANRQAGPTGPPKNSTVEKSPSPPPPAPVVEEKPRAPAKVGEGSSKKNDVKAMLGNFLVARTNPLASIPIPAKQDDIDSVKYAQEHSSPVKSSQAETATPPPPPSSASGDSRPALKEDPKYERYFRMLKVGMPLEVVKHAMQKDGNDPSVLDGDHNKPVGLALKDDPKYTKYFKMLKMGISMPQVQHAMERDGLMPDVMEQDHNLPANACEQRSRNEPKTKDTHRRARLHWKTLQRVTRNSLWSKIEKEPEGTEVDFDEEEFRELFQADLTPSLNSPKGIGSSRKKGAAVRIIDAKRANNGGIILARVKMSHDEMADAVDRIDGDALTGEQIENIIEFLPTKEERSELEKYMLEGGQDAADKFDGLCECEKFMVSMMTVKHAKRKVKALLFKLQFVSCLQSIAEDARLIEDACDQLKHSTRLQQLLGIVLQFGNRLNTAGKSSKRKAGAFTLDSLLKLSQAKAFDKKTTFLHYLVLVVHRNNETLLNFTDDLPAVLKADKVFWDQCLSDLEEVENQLENVRRISLHEARAKQSQRPERNGGSDDDSLGELELTLEEEVEALRGTPTGLFTLSAIKQVSALRDKVESTRSKFMKALEYFGEDSDSMQPHELFNIFCVFGRDFNKAKEVALENMRKKMLEERKKERNQTPPMKNGKPPTRPEHKPLRASSHQPNMSKVISDIRSLAETTSSSQPQNQPTPAPTTRAQELNVHKRENPSTSAMLQQTDRRAPRDSTRLNARPEQGSTLKAPLPQNPPYQSPVPEDPIPRGMQEAGHFDIAGPITRTAVPTSAEGPREPVPPRNSAKETLRQKARSRRQRMQVVSGRTTPLVSNTSSTNAQRGANLPESRSPRNSPIEMSLPSPAPTPTPPAPSPKTAAASPRYSMRQRRLQAMKRMSAKSAVANGGRTEWPDSSDVPAS